MTVKKQQHKLLLTEATNKTLKQHKNVSQKQQIKQ